MYYYLIIALQAFCIYHSIKNRNEYYWVFLILFIPVIGAGLYLIMNVINKNDVTKVQEGLATVINPSRKVEAALKKLEFTETFQNKVDVADAYFEINDFTNAIIYYKKSLDTTFSTDAHVLSQLTNSLFFIKNYADVIVYFKKLENTKSIIKATTILHYGLSLNEIGDVKNAEHQLKKVDISYANYNERFILAEFYIDKNKPEKAKEVLKEIFAESQNFTKDNKRIYKNMIRKVTSLLNELK